MKKSKFLPFFCLSALLFFSCGNKNTSDSTQTDSTAVVSDGVVDPLAHHDNKTQIKADILGVKIGETPAKEAVAIMKEQGYYLRREGNIYFLEQHIRFGGRVWNFAYFELYKDTVVKATLLEEFENESKLEKAFKKVRDSLMKKYKDCYENDTIPGSADVSATFMDNNKEIFMLRTFDRNIGDILQLEYSDYIKVEKMHQSADSDF